MTTQIVREETCCHMGYTFRLAARYLLYAPSHRQDGTYHGLCYTRRRALAGTRNTLNIKYKLSVYHSFIKRDIVDIKILSCQTAGLPSESPAQFHNICHQTLL